MNTRKVISRMLTLALAFVMVFTGIGIGDFGADTAYAAAPAITVTGGDLKASIDKISDHQCIYIIKPNDGVNQLSVETGIEFYTSYAAAYNPYDIGRDDEDTISATFTSNKKSITFSLQNLKPASSNLINSYLSDQSVYDAWKNQMYYVVYALTDERSIDYSDMYFLIEAQSDIDETKLKAAIEKAPEADEGKYYTSEDRYNGKKVSTKGFWVEMQEALTAAKTLFTDDTVNTLKEGVSAATITKAYNKLQDSIAALIPAGQANTTILYEAIQNAPTIGAGYPCDQENLTAFQTKKTEAQSLLSSLFSSGTATSANLVSAQSSIDEAAAALTASYADGKLDAVITTQAEFAAFMKQAPKNYKGVLKNDLSLSGYTPEYSFAGILDGNGYAVIADSTFKGLVTNNEGTIKNLRVKGVARTSVAAICRTNKGLIDSCANEADFSNFDNMSGKDRGAICDTNDTTGIIRNCYNTGKLTGMYIGGISGENWGLIENCFNAGIIDAESEAGGIVWRNRNDFSKLTNALNAKSGTIKDCYNFNVMHHANGWNGFYGSYIQKNLGPICGDNEKALVNISDNLKQIENEGTVENSLYLDTIVTNKPNGGSISIELSDIYTAKRAKFQSEGAGTKAGTAIAGWTEKDSENSIFAYDTDYYVFYDKSNDRFIAVTFSADATSNLIDAANPSDKTEKCTSAAGDEKDFYLVEIPTGSTKVQFKNTVKIIDYANGYTNKYVRAYQQLDHAGVTSGAELSRKFVGTALKSSDIENVLNKVKTICGSDNDTITFVTEMLAGIDNEKQAAGGESEKKISVEFRLVGATKSTSGNYDLGAKPPVKDSQYVTWIATKSYSVSDGSTVGDLLKLAIKESGMSSQGQEANYVSGMYAPTILGNYYLGEFTNGKRSGWMYSVNGKHPNVGLNGYILKDGDSVIWHYINDYSYECSDWFNDAEYPNLGDASTWDPWLKVADVNPTKNTPMVGVAAEETKDVESDKTAGTTTSPTDVKVSEKTNADGTKESVATVTVSAENQKEILAQAKSNKSKEIILQVSKNSVKDATKADVQLDKSFIEGVLKDTDAKLTVKTPFGDKTYTQDELKALAAAAAGKTVSLEIVKSEKTDEELKAEQLEAAKATVAKASMKARSTKTAKGNVKIVFKPDTKTQNFINEMKDMGYTVKYRFYRSTKKSSGYKAMLTKTSKTYTNTSGKKGTKYYYKVQVRVYDENGKCVAKTALKQCKYASRTWSK